MLQTSAEKGHVSYHGAAASDQWLIAFTKVMDAGTILGLLALSVVAYRPVWDVKYSTAGLLAAILFFLLAEIAGLYRPWRGETFARQFLQILLVWGQTLFILLLLAYALKITHAYSRVAVGVWLILTPALLTGWRIVGRAFFNRVIARHGYKRNALVWGSGELGDQLARTITESPWLGLNLTDYVRDTSSGGTPDDRAGSDPPGGQTVPERLGQRAKVGEFEILYIALPSTSRARIVELLDILADTTITVYMVPDYFTTSLFHGKWSNLEGIPLISVYDTPFWGADGWVKRAEDVILSALFLVAAALPMAVIGGAVKLSSPGPAIFKQRRYGMNGEEISVWKFRTMTVCEDGDVVAQAVRNDPRVTAIGALLRRTSMDELPQLINVLMGQMSIVGPRPHAVAHNEIYRSQVQGYMLRHKVRPGITGWAQVNGWRGETDTLEKMKKRIDHDLWYIRNWSLWLDLKIISLTLVRGLRVATAY